MTTLHVYKKIAQYLPKQIKFDEDENNYYTIDIKGFNIESLAVYVRDSDNLEITIRTKIVIEPGWWRRRGFTITKDYIGRVKRT